MRNRFFLILTAFLAVIICYGCSPSQECNQYMSFFETPVEEREAILKQYKIDEQLNIYQCGMKRHPPDMGLAGQIAGGGDAIVPATLARLKEEKDEANQRDLILIFQHLAQKGYLKNRVDICNELSEIISKMRNDDMKNSSKRMLDNIEKTCKTAKLY